MSAKDLDKRALAVYVRVSEVGERDGPSFGSPEEQEIAAREWAERAGLEVYFDTEECVDLDVSGATAVTERRLGRLIERCEAGEFGGIIVRDERRFARDEIAGGVALDRLTEAGCRLKATWSGFDTGPFGEDVTPESRMVFDFFMAIGKAERARNRLARVKGSQRKAAKGFHLAARCPIGYRWVGREKGGRTPTAEGGCGKLEIDPVMGKKVREAFRRRAAGVSFEELGKFLGLAGKSSARAVIRNRVYLGEARVVTERKGESKIVKNAHKPLVTPAEWEAANARGGNYTQRAGVWSALTRLSGLAKCPGCEHNLSVGSSRGAPYYSCTAEGCKKRTGIAAAALDEHVGLLLTEAVYAEVPEVLAILAGDDRYQRALDAVAAAQEELDTYRAEIKVSDVGAADWKRDLASRQAALDVARAALRDVPRTQEAYSAPIPVTAEQWSAASKDERVALVEHAMDRDRLARFVDRVVVHPVGRGRKVPAADRTSVYFIGAEAPWAAPVVEEAA
jgi:DNA invertase Pin-like site-specific DNA recombinase